MLKVHRQRTGEFDHELVWALVGTGLLLAWSLYPIWKPPLFGVCLLKTCTGIPCALCGGTRSLLAGSRGDLGAAWRWNPLVCSGVIAFGVYWSYCVVSSALRVKTRIRLHVSDPLSLGVVRWGAATLLALNWIYLIYAGR